MNGRYLMLTIFLDATDMEGEIPLYEVIVRRLLHLDIAGATVWEGIMGFGKQGKVHRRRLFGVSDDKPAIITAVDQEDKIRAAVAQIRPMVKENLMMLQEVEVAPFTT